MAFVVVDILEFAIVLNCTHYMCNICTLKTSGRCANLYVFNILLKSPNVHIPSDISKVLPQLEYKSTFTAKILPLAKQPT